MWYEILPSFFIIAGLFSVPPVVTYATNMLMLGQPFRRKYEGNFNLFQICRDSRINNGKSPYGFVGLENIPDDIVASTKGGKEDSKNDSSRNC
ncbi:UNVERIFIED_CONTAM: hypothetical protein PYX00_010539 [Menopon gallinae]|uniref:NADH-ubiquinone oxidoreductase MWFE subunit n=1 Tax=Menopon gallinae TaxID=328185 RepID=A0AAW2HG10_9NEOP